LPKSLNYIPTVVSNAILTSNWTISTLPPLQATIPTQPFYGPPKEKAKDRVGGEALHNAITTLVVAPRLVTPRPVLPAPLTKRAAGKANLRILVVATLNAKIASLKK
jgi:hypothetical protein